MHLQCLRHQTNHHTIHQVHSVSHQLTNSSIHSMMHLNFSNRKTMWRSGCNQMTPASLIHNNSVHGCVALSRSRSPQSAATFRESQEIVHTKRHRRNLV